MGVVGGARQIVMGAGYWLKPARIRDLPHLTLAMGSALASGAKMPEAADIRSRPPGFAGIAWNPAPAAVVEAARRGFYPHAHIGPMKWWSPPRRGVMMLDEVHLPKRFRRTLRNTDMVVTIDRAFQRVLEACAAPRPGRPHLTWLTPRAQALYNRLHAAGHAHSVEVWDSGGNLVGGVFGVDVDPVFSALSMFHTVDDASKLAIVSLYHHLSHRGFIAVDHQVISGWVRDLGGVEMDRDAYGALLDRPSAASPDAWRALFTPAQTAEWRVEHR
ncbi:leucyl/phenylalanyl-tRNA--protein transferase [Aliihoeflea sp. 40Bstr573]|uniref:leucyl/phenylalanyl-tRNA--protein transferase n=1 Tax=Aliihoeflea sp. 40Bstr573 TaxID=2696467 RepID=UPI002094B5F4|nr:leucyl/phenylalanyl-tRNA--protein transferase [Aliihoeflea sp. 40Bstr573]MCO6386548.1 leucyl/phenylalanyl-tRNA--protein transferase [Aliihoeflea sp. 40Bstr573]